MLVFNDVLESISLESKKILKDGRFENVNLNSGLSFSFVEVGVIPSRFDSQFDSLFSLIYKDDILFQMYFHCSSLPLCPGEFKVYKHCSFHKNGKELDLSELTNSEQYQSIRKDISDFFEEKYETAFTDIYKTFLR